MSWLPQYHDLGYVSLSRYCQFVTTTRVGRLVYAHISHLCHGARTVNMSPLSFLQNPLLWLQAASDYQAHFFAAPDFGYRLLTRRVMAKISKGTFPSLRLDKVVGYLNAAERVRASTSEELSSTLAPFGWQAIMVPGYGIAEHVACVSLAFGVHVSSGRA